MILLTTFLASAFAKANLPDWVLVGSVELPLPLLPELLLLFEPLVESLLFLFELLLELLLPFELLLWFLFELLLDTLLLLELLLFELLFFSLFAVEISFSGSSSFSSTVTVNPPLCLLFITKSYV